MSLALGTLVLRVYWRIRLLLALKKKRSDVPAYSKLPLTTQFLHLLEYKSVVLSLQGPENSLVVSQILSPQDWLEDYTDRKTQWKWWKIELGQVKQTLEKICCFRITKIVHLSSFLTSRFHGKPSWLVGLHQHGKCVNEKVIQIPDLRLLFGSKALVINLKSLIISCT